MKGFLVLLFFLFANTAFAKLPTSAEIDKKLSVKFHELDNSDQYVSLNLKCLNDSREISYSKGIAISSYRLALVLNFLGEFKKGFYHLKISEAEIFTKNDPQLAFKLVIESAENYLKLGLADKALEKFRPALSFKKPGLFISASAYSGMGICYSELNLLDSAWINQKRAYNLIKSSKVFHDRILLSSVSSHLGDVFSKMNKNDSANFYLSKGLKIANLLKNPHSIAIATNFIGQFHLRNHQPDSAILYLKTSLQIFKKESNLYEITDIYKLLYHAYKLKNNLSEENAYRHRYIALTDSLEKKRNLSVVIKTMLDEEQNKHYNKRKMTLAAMGIISLILILISLYAYYKFKNYKRTQKKILDEKQSQIKFISEVRSKAEIESVGLLLELAKSKDPAFFVKFNELYPSFKDKLLTQYLDLRVNDVEFCAYLRMNFNTKEIARFANMAVRSVEYKKYRLRKKMNISSAEDINLFVANL